MEITAEHLAQLAAIIVAVAALYKAIKPVNDLAKRVTALETENCTLKAQVTELTQKLEKSEAENKELRDTNEILVGVNKEYREQLLVALRPKRTGD